MVSALLLNYKRPGNMAAIMAAIRKQTVPTEIILWDNGVGKPPGADITVTVNKSRECYVRFLTVGLARFPYVWIQDDDFILTDPGLFARLIPIADAHPECFLSPDGRILASGPKPYQCGSPAPRGPAVCANTGFSFARTKALSDALPLNPLYCEKCLKPGELRWADDIWVSAHVKPWVTPEILESIAHYNEGSVGVSKEPGHMEARNTAAVRLLREKK